jgi:hypothetical protein
MKKILNVFGVIEGCGLRRRFRGFLVVAGLARIDAFKNAELAKIGEADLELSYSLCPGDVVLCLSRSPSLLNLGHPSQRFLMAAYGILDQCDKCQCGDDCHNFTNSIFSDLTKLRGKVCRQCIYLTIIGQSCPFEVWRRSIEQE